jgi:GT2 family glycosyltransferase
MKTSIIITTMGRGSRLAIVLKALNNQVDEETEVVIVFDGYCRDDMESFTKIELSYRPVTIFLEKNRGRSAARNCGIKKSSGDLFIFLDDDRVPGPDFVKKHREAHREDCVVIGGRKEVRVPEDVLEKMSEKDITGDEYNRLFTRARFESGDVLLKKIYFILPFQSLRCLGFTTGNASVKRADMERAGLFNENFRGWGYEDTEMAYRLAEKKIKLIRKPSILNYHLLHDFDLKKRFKEEFRNHLYFFQLVKRNALLKTVVFLLFFQFFARLIFWRLYFRITR